MRALILALALGGCAVGHGYEAPAAFNVTYDVGCEEPTEDDREMLHRAAWLWLGWGISVSDGLDRGEPLSVCLRDGRLPGNLGGKAYVHGDGTYAIEVDRTAGARQYYYGTMAHEIGHLVLGGPGGEDHLPPDQLGIMSSAVRCPDSAPPYDCRWSADDIAHLESFGLRREGDLL